MTFDFAIGFAEPYFTIDGTAELHLNITCGAAASAAEQYHFKVTLRSTNGLYSQSFSMDLPTGKKSLQLSFPVPLAWANDFAVNLGDSTYPDACGLFTADMTVQCTDRTGAQPVQYVLEGYQAQLCAGVKEEILPTIGSLTAARADSRVPAGWGVWVQGLSVVRVTCTGAAGAYGSTITAYEFSGVPQQQNTAEIRLRESGTVTIPVTVVDSRLRRAAQTLTLDVQPYRPPVLTALASCRCDAAGAPEPAGTCLAAACTAEGCTLGGRNPLTVQCAWKTAAGEQYSTAVTLENPAVPQVIAENLSAGAGCEVKYTVSDAFYSTEYTDRVPGTDWLLHLCKDGVAVGKAAEQAGWFDVALPTRLRGDVTVEGTLMLEGMDAAAALRCATAAFAADANTVAAAAENQIVRCGRTVLFRLQCTLAAAPAAGAAIRLGAAPAGCYSTDWAPMVTALQGGTPCKGWIDREGTAWVTPCTDGPQNVELYGFGLI